MAAALNRVKVLESEKCCRVHEARRAFPLGCFLTVLVLYCSNNIKNKPLPHKLNSLPTQDFPRCDLRISNKL